MVRVLLTGATGLIGRTAARALADAGHEVIALSRSGQADATGQTIACDLLDPDQASAVLRDVRANASDPGLCPRGRATHGLHRELCRI